jgi:ankyrin repeat protein
MVSAFTTLVGASLLHVAAEYGHLKVARVLLEMGADVDARAAADDFGLNGHTPLFHTVNSNGNRSEPVMRLLLDAGARSDIHLLGITWGKGFEWETTCFDALAGDRGLRDSANGCSQRLESGQFDDERVGKAAPKGYHLFQIQL